MLVGVADRPLSLKTLRAGQAQLSFLYKGVSSKTLQRDIRTLVQEGLVLVNGDTLEANLGVMTQFTQ